MTENASNIPALPDRSERVREALLRFETSTTRPSAVMGLSDEQLFEVALMLSDRERSIVDAWKLANESLNPEDQIHRTTFYRFADKFKSLLGQVSAEHARRRVRLSVAHATDENIQKMNQLSRHRFAELLAEKLVSTDDLAEIDRYMSKMASVLADAERARQADERLELDQLNYERRLSETRAKLDIAEQRVAQMQREADLKRERIEERLSQLRDTLDGLAKRAARGERITGEQLRHADADLEAVRGEAA